MAAFKLTTTILLLLVALLCTAALRTAQGGTSATTAEWVPAQRLPEWRKIVPDQAAGTHTERYCDRCHCCVKHDDPAKPEVCQDMQCCMERVCSFGKEGCSVARPTACGCNSDLCV